MEKSEWEAWGRKKSRLHCTPMTPRTFQSHKKLPIHGYHEYNSAASYLRRQKNGEKLDFPPAIISSTFLLAFF